MFQPSPDRAIVPVLQGIADEIEELTPGLFVIAAQQFCYPVLQSLVDLWITEPRRFNVLEEFILRAAADLDPAPTIRELAEVLGLDFIFLDKTFSDLATLDAVSFEEEGRILLTALGRTYYEDGQVPQPPRREQVYFLYDPLLSAFSAQKSALTAIDHEMQPLSDKIELDVNSAFIYNLTLDQVRDVLLQSPLQCHDLKQGKLVTEIDIKTAPTRIMQPVSLFLLYDELEQSWSLQARRGKNRLSGAQAFLDCIVEEGRDSLVELFGMSSAHPDEDDTALDGAPDANMVRFSIVNDLAREALKQERESAEATGAPLTDAQTGTVTVIRNEKIRPEFMKLLQSVQKEIYVFSPWITEQVVDGEFIALLQELAARNVWILIGYGINRDRNREDRPIPVSVEKRIHALRTPQGSPAARVVWLGGSHAKEVVVDGKVYLHGSFNWLSYRGDRCVRRETVSRITIPDIVSDAREEYAGLFLKRAHEIWLESGHDRGSADGLTTLSILGALGRELESLDLLLTAGRLDMLPEWIRIVASNIVHGDTLHAFQCLGAASEVFPDVQDKDIDMGQFRSSWQVSLTQLYSKDPGLAYELLRHPSWECYPGLGLAGVEDSPESYLSSISKPVSNVVTRKKKKKK